jgi:hypothetical protein
VPLLAVEIERDDEATCVGPVERDEPAKSVGLVEREILRPIEGNFES